MLADEAGTLGVEYASGADRVFVWDSSGIGARTDYNGVLLLHTALQRPLPISHTEKNIKIELVLSEVSTIYSTNFKPNIEYNNKNGHSSVINIYHKLIQNCCNCHLKCN